MARDLGVDLRNCRLFRAARGFDHMPVEQAVLAVIKPKQRSELASYQDDSSLPITPSSEATALKVGAGVHQMS